MSEKLTSAKACTVNPLKMSRAAGSALAFLGVDGCLPLFHGSQGCTAFSVVLFVRHFHETIPLQTTAMTELSTILGGFDHIEQALLTIYDRAHPKIVGLISTGLTETGGDDVEAFLTLIRRKHPHLADMEIVFVPAADFDGGFQQGWQTAVERMIETLCVPQADINPTQINVLPGCHITPGDIDDLRDIIAAFDLEAVFLPDLSGSLDGHMPETFGLTTLGGTSMADARRLGRGRLTLALGSGMAPAARMVRDRCGTPFEVFERVTGLEATDRLMRILSATAGKAVPARFRRQRSQVIDAMLDAHFQFSGLKVALALEPDLLFELSGFFADLGARIVAAVSPTAAPGLGAVAGEAVRIGDFEDLERRAARTGAEILVSSSHGRQVADRLGIPLWRAGLPIFDRVGSQARSTIGYRGTRTLMFDIANVILGTHHDHPAPDRKETRPLSQSCA